jgi:hypothetical protein
MAICHNFGVLAEAHCLGVRIRKRASRHTVGADPAVKGMLRLCCGPFMAPLLDDQLCPSFSPGCVYAARCHRLPLQACLLPETLQHLGLLPSLCFAGCCLASPTRCVRCFNGGSAALPADTCRTGPCTKWFQQQD